LDIVADMKKRRIDWIEHTVKMERGRKFKKYNKEGK
jgi:hypothetical protein